MASPPVLGEGGALSQRGQLSLHRWAEPLMGGKSLRVLSAGLSLFVICSSFAWIQDPENRREVQGRLLSALLFAKQPSF